MTTRKCVSREVLPAMAWWCACRAESLWISREVGCRASVIWRVLGEMGWESHGTGHTFRRIASSMGVCEVVMVERERRARVRSGRRSIKGSCGDLDGQTTNYCAPGLSVLAGILCLLKFELKIYFSPSQAAVGRPRHRLNLGIRSPWNGSIDDMIAPRAYF